MLAIRQPEMLRNLFPIHPLASLKSADRLILLSARVIISERLVEAGIH